MKASRRDFEKAREGLVLKVRKLADVSSKMHVRDDEVRKQANVTSKWDAEDLSSK